MPAAPVRPAENGSSRSRGPGIVAIAAALLVIHLWRPTGAIGEWTYLLAGCGAAAIALVGARRSTNRHIAGLVAAGITLSAVGDLTYQVLVWTNHTVGDVSLADIGWLGSYVGLIAALLSILRAKGERWLNRAVLGDIGAACVVSLVVQWQLTLADVLTNDHLPVLTRVMWAAYPTLDAVVLALVARAASARYLRGRAGVLLALGAALWLLSDVVYSALGPDSSGNRWLDIGWLAGSMALAGAVWGANDRKAIEGRPLLDSLDSVTPTRLAVAMGTLCVPATIEVVGDLFHRDPDPVPLFLATLALVGMAYARSVFMVRSIHHARASLRSQERRSRLLAANSADAVAIVDAGGVIRDDAAPLASLLGFAGDDAVGMDIFARVVPDDLASAQAVFERTIRTMGQALEIELRVMHRDGEVLWFAVRFVNLLDDPDVHGIVVNVHDITRRKLAEQALEHQAFHDNLTGLPNRALFTDRVEHALQRSAGTGGHPAVLFLDLDGFKVVNDSLGHASGDELLREVAARLTHALRTDESVARLGGDEFAVLIEPSPWSRQDAEATADRVLRALAGPITVGNQEVTISASLGLAIGGVDATASSLLRDADVAMYRAKSAGKGTWVLYETEMRAAVVERLRLESDLAQALPNGQLFLVYQPVVRLDSEQIVGFEALLRWRHPTFGVICPDRFVPIAEENGLIVPIGAWVIDEACRTAARWHREHPRQPQLTMAVNVSARQLTSGALVPHVARALEMWSLDPASLVVELTESALVHDAPVAAARLQALRDLGLRIAVDDFGTGYSSLSYLRQFPIDILKLDRTFVHSITSRHEIPALVRGLLELGRTLELEMVAEGVELEVQRDQLRREHCDLAQGFLFAEPLDAASASLLLDQADHAGVPARAL